MDRVPAMALALDASFGSVERWWADFVAAGERVRTHRRLVMLAFSEAAARLVNRTDVDTATPGFTPLLRLEGSDDRFVPGEHRLGRRLHVTSLLSSARAEFAAGHDDLAGALVLDVRRKAMFEQAATRLPGADWRDPARVAAWSGAIPADRPVVVYCIYGHEVGRATALRLRAASVDARFLQGGIDGWQSAGRAARNFPKEYHLMKFFFFFFFHPGSPANGRRSTASPAPG